MPAEEETGASHVEKDEGGKEKRDKEKDRQNEEEKGNGWMTIECRLRKVALICYDHVVPIV